MVKPGRLGSIFQCLHVIGKIQVFERTEDDGTLLNIANYCSVCNNLSCMHLTSRSNFILELVLRGSAQNSLL